MRIKRKLAVVLTLVTGAACFHASVAGAPSDILVHYGDRVRTLDFPWQVALVTLRPDGTRRMSCGGSIIAPGYVLTAAHCVDRNVDRRVLGDPAPGPQGIAKVEPGSLRVVVGSTEYATGGRLVGITRIDIHGGWKSTTIPFDFDAAILKLEMSVEAARAIKLYRNPLLPQDGEAWVSGWGKTERGIISETLLAGKVPVVGNDVCTKPESYGGYISATMLCAGHRQGGIDSCEGDSGGPLAMGTAASPALVGVVSWGDGCGKPDKYGVYTRIDSMRGWIAATTGNTAVFTSSIAKPLFSPSREPRLLPIM